jgi:hypothetical protein
MNTKTLLMVYFSYFHSILKYGIIFCGNSTNYSRVFKLQIKKLITIIFGVNLEPHVGIFLRNLSCEYILSLVLFVIDNQNNFCSGLEVHGLNIRSQNQLYLPILNLSVFQNGTMCTSIRLYNRQPMNVQNLRKDRSSFKNKFFFLYLMNNSFYTVAEFLEYTMNN